METPQHYKKATSSDSENIILAPEEIAMLLAPAAECPAENGYLQHLACLPPRRQLPETYRRLQNCAVCLQSKLEKLCSRAPAVSFSDIQTGSPRPQPGEIYALFTGSHSQNAVAVFSRDFGNALTGAMLGSSCPEISAAPQRSYSVIEKQLLCAAAAKFAEALDSSVPGKWKFCRLQEAIPPQLIKERHFTAGLQFDFNGHKAKAVLILPQNNLIEAVSAPKNVAGKQNAQKHLQQAARRSPIEITAVLKQAEYSLRRLEQWEIGSFIPLNMAKDEEISLFCGKNIVFKGIMGKKGQNIAVKITKVTAHD